MHTTRFSQVQRIVCCLFVTASGLLIDLSEVIAATVTPIADLATFESAVGPTQVFDLDASGFEAGFTTFETPGGVLEPGTGGTLVNSPIDFGSFALAISGADNTLDDTFFGENAGDFANQADGDGVLILSRFSGEHEIFRFTFDDPILSFGALITSNEDDLVFDFEFAGGSIASATLLADTDFVGFQFDEGVNAFEISADENVLFVLGDFRTTAIPEPTSLLKLTALLGAAFFRRDRTSVSLSSTSAAA
ncbi:MAG: hypothetical protein AAF539_14850 [Planctomycetota bacterium]